ncbi:tyrosine-type recombinase/integrase [Bradyrhizobium liaoningense]|nr:tyrosine-type recombinase/integrase [Bradyrhizobium liaoningense]
MMPRKLPLHVERNTVKGNTYLSVRIRSQNGPRIRLPDDPTSEEFRLAYAAAMGGTQKPATKKDSPDSISAKIDTYMKSPAYTGLSDSSKDGYSSRLEQIRTDHGHRAFSGLTKERIETFILAPLANKPGAALDTLKKLRILINHLKLTPDPTAGIKRPKGGEIRAWTDRELAAYERRWPLGTKQRTAYALMLNMGTARVDTHLLTWHQVDDGACYRRHKTGVQVDMDVSEDLEKALAAMPRKHVVVITTAYGKPFTVDGFSRFMRDAITAAKLPLSCQPHGLRKTLGRLLADAGCSAHDIMAALGHTTLAEAERYTREADRKRGGERAVTQLNEHRKNKPSQTTPGSLGKTAKSDGKTTL